MFTPAPLPIHIVSLIVQLGIGFPHRWPGWGNRSFILHYLVYAQHNRSPLATISTSGLVTACSSPYASFHAAAKIYWSGKNERPVGREKRQAV